MRGTRYERVVRCHECRYARRYDAGPIEGYDLVCALRPLMKHSTRRDDYCSNGERREDGWTCM